MNIGKPIERTEDLRLLRGKGRFGDDLHKEGMLHAVLLRSTVAHGRLRSIDAARALKIPGVHAVYTAEDVAKVLGGPIPTIPPRFPRPELVPFEQPVIAHGEVRYVGEPVAIVVAESAALAEDALPLIEVDIEPLPVEMKRGGTRAAFYTGLKGDPDSVKAPYVRKERFHVHRHTAVPLEPKCLLADWEGEKTKLTVYGAAKVPFINRRILARHMDLPDECVDMVEVDVGGGFGVRGDFQPEDFLVAFAARRLRRPVKWTEDRLEHLMASNHARDIECELEIACERDGTILALRGYAWTNCGAYFRNAAAVPPQNVAQFISGPYRVPHVKMESEVLLTNKSPIGVYRGPGRFEGDFFRERLFDMAAADLGIDRVEFRRRNLPRPEELPYPIATITPPGKAESLDNGDYHAALDRCLKEFDWAAKAPLAGKKIDGRYHGIAVGCFIEGGGAGPRENARIVLDEEGGASVFIGSCNVGQGMETVFAQIAADAIGLPMEKIRVFHGSTTYLKEGFGSYHSRSVVMGGSAILDAAAKLKAQPGLKTAEGTFANNGIHTYAYGAAAAHVAVDPGTGRVELLDYVTVEDVGRVMNPLTANGQAIGAVMQGLGGVFLEHLQYDAEGQFLTGSLADYLLPSATDFPRIRAFVTGDAPCPSNPLGAKGGGEGGIVPVAGVIGNAVANALASFKVEPRDLPLSPPRVWELLNQRGQSKSGAREG